MGHHNGNPDDLTALPSQEVSPLSRPNEAQSLDAPDALAIRLRTLGVTLTATDDVLRAHGPRRIIEAHAEALRHYKSLLMERLRAMPSRYTLARDLPGYTDPPMPGVEEDR